MKKTMSRFLLFVFLLTMLILAGCSQQKAIQWKEPVIESAVRDYLGKPEGELFPQDLEKISSIVFVGDRSFINAPFIPVNTVSARDSEAILNTDTGASRTNQGSSPSSISSLEDFAHFPNLEELSLYDMSFEKLDGINKLGKNKKLKSFALCFDSKLTSLKGIEQLRHLTKLRLVGLPVTDLSNLKDMASLTTLEISDIPVENLQFMEKLQNVETLMAYQVPVLDWQKVLEKQSISTYEIRLLDGTELQNTSA